MNHQQLLYESLDEDTKKRYDEKKEFLQLENNKRKKRYEFDSKIKFWFFSIAVWVMIIGLFLSMYEFIISIICQCSMLWPWYYPLSISIPFALGVSLFGMLISTDF